MDLEKMGGFLRELRKEKGLTQEELAEKLFVSSKTISRWERGKNMPDIEILLDLSEFYGLELIEILGGERRNGEMNKEVIDTSIKVSEYEKELSKIWVKAFRLFMLVALLGNLANQLLYKLKPSLEGAALSRVNFIMGFFEGFTIGVLVLGVLYSYGLFEKGIFKKFREKKVEILENKKK